MIPKTRLYPSLIALAVPSDAIIPAFAEEQEPESPVYIDESQYTSNGFIEDSSVEVVS